MKPLRDSLQRRRNQRLSLCCALSTRYNSAALMSSPLASAIAGLASPDNQAREAAARQIYREGRVPADRVAQVWCSNAALSSLLVGPNPAVTVGVAVTPETFRAIRQANGTPRLAEVPPDQDAEEFELHFPDKVTLDVLTTKEPGGLGAIARYLAKFGEGIQQVEFLCHNVDRAADILREAFQLTPIYPATRKGADGTRINFFLVGVPGGGKVLIELYERQDSAAR
jgi:hypothetical protein